MKIPEVKKHKYSDVSFEKYLEEVFGLKDIQYTPELKKQINEPAKKKNKKPRVKVKLCRNRKKSTRAK